MIDYVHVSGTLFLIVAVLQALRASKKWPIQIADWSIPVGASWIAAAITGSLAFWAFRG